MVVRLSHIFLIVSNVEAQVRLLVDVVGLELLVQEEGPPEEQEWGARRLWFRDVDGRRMSLFKP
jgi:catechol 2,3-dioxygenase-like lactoylglutathione lyase family enzyme